MHTWSRAGTAHPGRQAHRTVMVLAALGVLFVVGALAAWRGAPPAIVVPAMATALGAGLFVAGVVTAGRALRRASHTIDTILREELGPECQSGGPPPVDGTAAADEFPFGRSAVFGQPEPDR